MHKEPNGRIKMGKTTITKKFEFCYGHCLPGQFVLDSEIVHVECDEED